MNYRGAVEKVVAAVVIKLSNKLIASDTITEPLLNQDQFTALICMTFITTIKAFLSLKWIGKNIVLLTKMRNSAASGIRVKKSERNNC